MDIKKIFFMFMFFVIINISYSQEKKIITGFVYDGSVKNGKEPLIGATIVEDNTTNGTATNNDGSYKIKVNSLTGVLVFSYFGFETKEIKYDITTSVLDVFLEAKSEELEEIVVVGYGVQKKNQVTGAISSIDAKEFIDKPVSNLASSMQGRVSGVNVSQTSGTPGGGINIAIRGNSNPLYVVDGVPMISESNSSIRTSQDLNGNDVGTGQNLSSISDINPNDIERIEVLKDASASAIYGSRAANGVILVTTKRGKEGKTDISFSGYSGFQMVAKPLEFLSSQQYFAQIEEARKNDLNKLKALTDDQIFDYFGDYSRQGLTDILTANLADNGYFKNTKQNTNWLNEVTRIAPINNYELSIRGGGAKTKFFFGGGIFLQDGVVIQNYYNRGNIRLNLDHEINKKFNIGVNLSASISRNKRSFNDNTYTGIITNALGASPLMPVYESDGTYSVYSNYEAYWLSDNPVKSANEKNAFTNTYRLIGSTFADYEFIKGLKFKTSFSIDFNQVEDQLYLSPLTSDASSVSGKAQDARNRSLTWLNENILSYTKLFNNSHNLNVLSGVTLQQTDNETVTSAGQGFVQNSGVTKISNAATINSATSSGTNFSLLSFIGRLNYGFKDKYLLTASVRADGSSRFSEKNRFGVFPSASLAWRMSEEPFFRNTVLTDFKLRTSVGLTGDQEIGDFQQANYYKTNAYNGLSGISLRNIADPNLTWQENLTINAGFDFEFVKGLVSGSFEFFQATKSKLLSEDNIPSTSGFKTIVRNSGEIQNTGVEFNLNASPITNKHFNWKINFNFTYLNNKVIKLTNNNQYLRAYSDIGYTHILKEGEAVGSFVGIKYLGVDQNTGDPKYQDFNNDGKINKNDNQILGKATPDFFGGLTNTFKIFGFDVSIFLRYSIGNSVYNLIRYTTNSLGYSKVPSTFQPYANNTVDVLNRWQNPGDNKEYPRYSFIKSNFNQLSSQAVEDASFLRIQNLTIGYVFNFTKIITSLRVYAEFQNLYVFTNYKGFDPEVSSTGSINQRISGVDYGAYPQPRTITFGLKLNF